MLKKLTSLLFKCYIFLYLPLIQCYSMTAELNQKDNQTEASDVRQRNATSRNKGKVSEEIQLYGLKSIEPAGPLDGIEGQERANLSHKTTSHGLRHSRTSRDSSSTYNEYKGRKDTAAYSKHLAFAEEPALTTTKPEEPALSTTKPEEPALTTIKPEEPALTSTKLEEPALTTIKPEEPDMLNPGHKIPEEEGEDEADSTATRDTKGFKFNKTEVFLYEEQQEAERKVENTLKENSDIFDWRRIYNITKPEQAPYSVLLVMSRMSCTGSILTEQWVLTAAHCLMRVSAHDGILVYAGGNSEKELRDYYQQGTSLPATAQLLKSCWFVMHPYYTMRGEDSDIALIKVKGGFNMTKTVNKVSLETKPWKKSYKRYSPCEVTGFGIVQTGETHEDDNSRKTTSLEVRVPCKCSFMLEAVYGIQKVRRYVCTQGRKDYGVCFGDSGGGLVCQGKLRAVASMFFTLVNLNTCILTNDNVTCANSNTINVFMDVCQFLHWINFYTKLFHPSEISKECVFIKPRQVNVSSITVNTKSGTYLLWFSIFTTDLIKTLFL